MFPDSVNGIIQKGLFKYLKCSYLFTLFFIVSDQSEQVIQSRVGLVLAYFVHFSGVD